MRRQQFRCDDKLGIPSLFMRQTKQICNSDSLFYLNLRTKPANITTRTSFHLLDNNINLDLSFTLGRRRQINSIFHVFRCHHNVNTTTCCHDTHFSIAVAHSWRHVYFVVAAVVWTNLYNVHMTLNNGISPNWIP